MFSEGNHICPSDNINKNININNLINNNIPILLYKNISMFSFHAIIYLFIYVSFSFSQHHLFIYFFSSL